MTSSELPPFSVPQKHSHRLANSSTNRNWDARSRDHTLRDHSSPSPRTHNKRDLSPPPPPTVILPPTVNDSELDMRGKNLSPLESSPYFHETTNERLRQPIVHDERIVKIDDSAEFYSQFIPLEAQAGGRKHAKPSKEGKAVGCLQSKKLGLVMKTLQEGDRGSREAAFYRQIFVEDVNDLDRDAIMFLREFIPKFYGVVQRGDDSYAILEDLTRGFYRPNVIDLKIGTQTYDPLASEKKRKKEAAKYCNMKDLGFCVTDYRQYDPRSKAFRNTDDIGKQFWRHLSNEQMGVEMLLRLLPSDATVRKRLIEACLERLLALQNFFHHQRSFAFYSSSILIIYEGDPEGAEPTPVGFVGDNLDDADWRRPPPPLDVFEFPTQPSHPRCVLANCRARTTGDANDGNADRKMDNSDAVIIDGACSFTGHIDRCRENPRRFSSVKNLTESFDLFSPSRYSPPLSICSWCSSSSSSSSSTPPSSSSSTPSSSSPHSCSPSRVADSRPGAGQALRLYLIDFAHAYHVTEVGLSSDQGCARGLDNLVAHFKSYLRLCCS